MTKLINNESFLIKILSSLILIMPYSIREDFYVKFGYTKSAFNDSYWLFRLRAYESLGYTEKAFSDKCSNIRADAYRELGYTKNAFYDSSAIIRYFAYQELGYTKESLNDSDFLIQCSAYLRLGFIEGNFEILDSGKNFNSLFDNFNVARKNYFENCKEILGNDKIKYKFSEEEASLLRMNNIPVNDLAVLN